jgi:hypothetical protein
LALAVQNYESTYRSLPASAIVNFNTTSTGNNGSWGVHGRILHFLEQADLYASVDINQGWDFQAAIDRMRIPIFACPSDAKADEMRDPGKGKVRLYATTYGFNLGTWFVFDPRTRRGGNGAFYPNSHLRMSAFIDGTTNTLLAAEVKAWQPYMRNGGPSTVAMPNTADEAAVIVASGVQFKNTGHTVWPDGRVHHTGFTATLTPNTFVPYSHGGTTVDADYNSWQEGRDGAAGSPSYAIVTSRSFHPGLVNTVAVDGSVRSIDNSVELDVWRAMATRASGD